MLPTCFPAGALGRAVAEHGGRDYIEMQKGCDYKGHPSCQVSVKRIITAVFYYGD